MTFYVDEDYYFAEFKGEIITEYVKKYLELAQEKIDTLTFNRIVKIGFDNLTDFQKEKVKKAVCYEAEHIYQNGFNNEENNDISSYNVLDISINVKNDTRDTKAKDENVCEVAYDLISKTGLNNRSFRY